MTATAIILAGHLRAAVRAVSQAVPRRGTIPILTHTLLAFEGDRLTATGTDMEVACTTTAVAQGMLTTTVNADALLRILRHLPSELVLNLRSDAKLGRLEIDSEVFKASLMALPVEDFPLIHGSKEVARFTLPAGSLRRLMDLPSSAISTEETRYYLNGIYLHVASPEGVPVLRSVATDGHRMLAADEALPEGAASLPGGILPRGTVRLLRSLLPARDDTVVTVAKVGDMKMRFECSSWVINTKLIDGTFPEYQRVVPQFTTCARIEVRAPRALSHAIATAGGISRERSRPLALSNGKGTALRLACSSADNGTAELLVPADVASWDEGKSHPTVGLQARYLKDLCAALPKGFTLKVTDGQAPVGIEFPGGRGFGVIMPMRV